MCQWGDRQCTFFVKYPYSDVLSFYSSLKPLGQLEQNLGTPVSSINKTNDHDITEILLKVVLNTITLVGMFIGWPSTQFRFICYCKYPQENSPKRNQIGCFQVNGYKRFICHLFLMSFI